MNIVDTKYKGTTAQNGANEILGKYSLEHSKRNIGTEKNKLKRQSDLGVTLILKFLIFLIEPIFCLQYCLYISPATNHTLIFCIPYS